MKKIERKLSKKKQKKAKQSKTDGDKTESFDDFEFFFRYQFHLWPGRFLFFFLCVCVCGHVLINIIMMSLHLCSGLINSPCKLEQSIFQSWQISIIRSLCSAGYWIWGQRNVKSPRKLPAEVMFEYIQHMMFFFLLSYQSFVSCCGWF